MILQDNIEILCKKGSSKIIRKIFGEITMKMNLNKYHIHLYKNI